MRIAFLLMPAILLNCAAAAARPPVETPRRLSNGWFYGEAGNYCMAIRELPGGERLSMRLAKWDDHSDHLLLWAPGLPSLDPEDEAAMDRHYDLEVRIDGRRIERAMHSNMVADFDGKPGPTYRLGIGQKAFIAALAEGRRLEIKRAGKLVRAFPIAGSAAWPGCSPNAWPSLRASEGSLGPIRSDPGPGGGNQPAVKALSPHGKGI